MKPFLSALFVIATVVVGFDVVVCRADGLPDDKQATTKPETQLAHIDLSKNTNISQAIEFFGKPTKKETSPNNPDWLGYFWNIKETSIEMETMKGTINRVYVHGDPDSRIEGTGAGVVLGDKLKKLVKKYGRKFDEKNETTADGVERKPFSGVAEPHRVTFEWKDQDQKLCAGFNKKGKIVSLYLTRGHLD